jgi:hypothetical protein
MEVLYFVIVNVLLVLGLLFLSYSVRLRKLRKEGKKEITLLEFLNKGELPPFKDISTGLIFGIVFGFMDNFGLWVGIDSLQKYMPGGILTKSALGNTYSDFLGATLGGFIAIMADDLLEYDDSDNPIWIDVVGIIIGCILGLFAGRLLTGKT